MNAKSADTTQMMTICVHGLHKALWPSFQGVLRPPAPKRKEEMQKAFGIV